MIQYPIRDTVTSVVRPPIPAQFMRREVVQMWKKALQVLLLAAILLLALSTKAC